jgi:serine/threonine-protein kinase
MSESRPRPDPDATGAYDAAAPTPAERFAPGTVLAGRYRIVAALGKGGMGEVYRADDLTLSQPVALKFLPPHLADDPDRLAHFRKEVAVARKVSHPNCCRVYDIAEADGHPLLSMEYVDGESLDSLLKRVGRLPEEKAIEVARQLCAALAAVHERGLLHRDLKPANVMLDGRGKVRLTDFGLATAADDLNAAEARSGTPQYMAPEQLTGREVSVRSDVFALGLVLYELFTGKKAFAGMDRSTPPSKPSSHVSALDPAVERAVLRCLETNPAGRPRSAYEVLAALPGGDPLQAALAAGETPSPELVAAAGGEGRLRPAVAVALLAAVVVGLAVWLVLFPKTMLIGQVPLPKPPAELAGNARDLIVQAGYEAARERAYGYDIDSAYLDWIKDNDTAATRWDALAQSQPAALHFWYRQSPEPLVPHLSYSYVGTVDPGFITWHNPAPVASGMVSVRLDTTGKLIEFLAIPPEWLPDGEADVPPREPDWPALFTAAGLDVRQFDGTAVPRRTPPVYAERRRAWVGTFPDRPHVSLRVEAGTFRGRLVHFQLVAPWTKRTGADAPAADAEVTGQWPRAVVFIALLVAAVVLAPRNLALGRADRIGAFRLAALVFALNMVSWLVQTRHVVGLEELRLLVMALAAALYWAALIWAAYVALEPAVRRFLPETLIAWNRLMAGGVRDPRVGRDLLIGVLFGVGLKFFEWLIRRPPAWIGVPPLVPSWDVFEPLTFVEGWWIGNMIVNWAFDIRFGFFQVLFAFLLFRVVFRKSWLAVGTFVLVYTVRDGLTFGTPPLLWGLHALQIGIGLALLLRWGILAFVVSQYVQDLLWFPMTTDLSAFYARDGLAALGIAVALAGYGCWTSLSGRTASGRRSPDHE